MSGDKDRTHSDWYDRFYSQPIAKSQLDPWYKGANKLLSRHFPNGLDACRVLEVGCGDGQFMSQVDATEKFGLDPSLEACRLASTNGTPAFRGVGEALAVRSNHFDVVLCCEVLEHVISPALVIAEIRRVLKDDGVVIISFPNFLHIGWLATRLLSDMFKKPDWIVRQPIDRYLTFVSVARLLRATGFQRCGLIGEVMDPPGLYHWRVRRGREPLSSRRLGYFAFHPVISAQKK
jgi:2-polyprenyl-3-methyl-5-hydroxy-6-metoxy-1,4-benzoquinol methylase